MRKSGILAGLVSFILCSWIAVAFAQSPSPSASPAADEDRARCYCWYIGYDSQPKNRTCVDMGPEDSADCDLPGRSRKQEWGDGCKWRRDNSGGRQCPY